MNDFIPKPVNPEKLYAMLLKWLPRRNQEYTPVISVAPPGKKTDNTEISTFRQRLENIPGLNVEEGLARVRGSEEKFAQIIDLFLRKHELDLEQLAEALKSGDMSTAEQIAHALKGSTSLIGATAAAATTAELLNSIRHKASQPEIETAYSTMAPKLQQLINGVKFAREVDQTLAEFVVADIVRCREILARLKPLLESGDMTAGALAHEERLVLQETLGNAASALLSAVQIFDFELALKELHNIDKLLTQNNQAR